MLVWDTSIRHPQRSLFAFGWHVAQLSSFLVFPFECWFIEMANRSKCDYGAYKLPSTHKIGCTVVGGSSTEIGWLNANPFTMGLVHALKRRAQCLGLLMNFHAFFDCLTYFLITELLNAYRHLAINPAPIFIVSSSSSSWWFMCEITLHDFVQIKY